MAQLSARNRRGPGTPFVARLIGLDPKYGFVRVFCPNPYADPAPGIYQVRDTDSNMRRTIVKNVDHYWRVTADGQMVEISASDARKAV